MIVQRYCTASGKRIEVQTLPGIMHALTARNNHNLVAIINELGTRSVGKVPYGLVARDIIENASTVNEAVEMLSRKVNSVDEKPASSHTLTLVDPEQACMCHMYAKDDYSFVARRLTGDGSLVVTNHAIDVDGRVIPDTEADDTTYARMRAAREALDAKASPQECLKAVNVMDTVAVAIYNIQKTGPNTAQTTVQYGHGGIYAGDTLSANSPV